MSRLLRNVEVGDWLRIVIDGLQTFEEIKRADDFVIATDNYKFTRYGQTCPKPTPNVIVQAATVEQVERWKTRQA
jgi:hypothetical protein